MGEAGYDEAFDVVGDAEIAAFDKGEGLCGAEQGKRAARADAEFQMIGRARRVDDLQADNRAVRYQSVPAT